MCAPPFPSACPLPPSLPPSHVRALLSLTHQPIVPPRTTDITPIHTHAHTHTRARALIHPQFIAAAVRTHIDAILKLVLSKDAKTRKLAAELVGSMLEQRLLQPQTGISELIALQGDPIEVVLRKIALATLTKNHSRHPHVLKQVRCSFFCLHHFLFCLLISLFLFDLARLYYLLFE